MILFEDYAPLAVSISKDTLLGIGAVGGLFVVMLSFSNWRLAVKSALVILLFEGALRKWFFASAQELVYFLKDGVLLGAYIRFFLFPDPDIRAYKTAAPTITIISLALLVSASAVNPNINSVLVALYGVKIYFFYLPLAFMIPYLFRTEEELARNLRLYALLATPICLIGVLQFAAPTSSIWNVYAQSGAATEASNFGWGGALEKVRITGTFSYLTGHTTFCVFFVAIHLALLVNKQTKIWQAILTINLALLFGNGLMGGSRTCVATMGLILIVYSFSTFGRPLGTSKHPTVLIGAAIGGVIAGGAYGFYTAWIYWSARLYGASDSIRSRVVDHTAHAMASALRDGGLFGYGMGTAHPAGEQIRKALTSNRQLVATPTYDHEMGQILVELGVVGFIAWYSIRFIMVLGLWDAFKNTKSGIVRSMLLGIVVLSLVHLYFLQVVYNHTAAVLICAGYGFALIPTLRPTIALTTRRPSNNNTQRHSVVSRH